MSYKDFVAALACFLFFLSITDISKPNSSIIHDATILLIASTKIDKDKRK